jgi:hypothetical protein
MQHRIQVMLIAPHRASAMTLVECGFDITIVKGDYPVQRLCHEFRAAGDQLGRGAQ